MKFRAFGILLAAVIGIGSAGFSYAAWVGAPSNPPSSNTLGPIWLQPGVPAQQTGNFSISGEGTSNRFIGTATGEAIRSYGDISFQNSGKAARRSFHLSKPTESKIRGGGARVECCPRTLARRASDAARQRFSASPAAQGTAPPSARRSPTSHSFPNPNINCSGTLTPTRVAGGALGPRPCSASRRVIWARVLATSAQRMGPEQRGQVSTSAAKT